MAPQKWSSSIVNEALMHIYNKPHKIQTNRKKKSSKSCNEAVIAGHGCWRKIYRMITSMHFQHLHSSCELKLLLDLDFNFLSSATCLFFGGLLVTLFFCFISTSSVISLIKKATNSNMMRFKSKAQKDEPRQMGANADEDLVCQNFWGGKLSLENNVFALKSEVGVEALIDAVGIGKQNDLTNLEGNDLKSIYEILEEKYFSKIIEIVHILSGDFGISKTQASDI
ncbi:transmembrane protein, putative [Medicago truncatula]|uniref:Transmembrane protein, putative n=1 Tax=Medicago truncatula TaxID=3880 RepID=G7LCM4_MEDTR|nr:transmembrane protein, putative [Medicago truncatula]